MLKRLGLLWFILFPVIAMNQIGAETVAARGRYAAGPSGYCICPKCGNKVLHQRNIPCQNRHCPKCGSTLIRELTQ